MAVILPKSVFLHIPKCGGTWVREAIGCAGIPFRETGQEEGDIRKREHEAKVLWNHSDYKQSEEFFEGRYVFTFVRFPLKWYQSFWAYRMKNIGVASNPTVFDEYMHKDFNKFVMAITKHVPGALTSLYERYTGWPLKCDYVGRQESLKFDLTNALNIAQEDFTQLAFKWIPHINLASTEDKWKPRCKYSKAAREAVIESENVAFERYGYDIDGSISKKWNGHGRKTKA